MVEVAKSRGSKLQSSEANIIQGLVVNAEALIGILDELMNGEGGVVWLNNSIGHLGRGNDRECQHDTVRILLTNLRNEKCAHSSASATTQGMRDLEALKTIGRFGLLSYNVEDRVDELSTLSVVTLSPIVACTSLTEHEVVRAEDLAIRTRTN